MATKSGRHRGRYLQTFVVTGTGPFPYDMMRYASAKFSSPAQEAEAAHKRRYDDPFRVTIDFEVEPKEEDRIRWINTVASRFASFGCRLTK